MVWRGEARTDLRARRSRLGRLGRARVPSARRTASSRRVGRPCPVVVHARCQPRGRGSQAMPGQAFVPFVAECNVVPDWALHSAVLSVGADPRSLCGRFCNRSDIVTGGCRETDAHRAQAAEGQGAPKSSSGARRIPGRHRERHVRVCSGVRCRGDHGSGDRSWGVGADPDRRAADTLRERRGRSRLWNWKRRSRKPNRGGSFVRVRRAHGCRDRVPVCPRGSDAAGLQGLARATPRGESATLRVPTRRRAGAPTALLTSSAS